MVNDQVIRIRWSVFPTIIWFLISVAIIGICWSVVLYVGYLGMLIPAILTLFFPGLWFFGILFHPFPVKVSIAGFSIFYFVFTWSEVSNFHVITQISRGIKFKAVAFSYSNDCKDRINKLSFYRRAMWLVFTIAAKQSKELNILTFPHNINIAPNKLLTLINQMQTIGKAG